MREVLAVSPASGVVVEVVVEVVVDVLAMPSPCTISAGSCAACSCIKAAVVVAPGTTGGVKGGAVRTISKLAMMLTIATTATVTIETHADAAPRSSALFWLPGVA